MYLKKLAKKTEEDTELYMVKEFQVIMNEDDVYSINPLQPGVAFLYPLKTSSNNYMLRHFKLYHQLA